MRLTFAPMLLCLTGLTGLTSLGGCCFLDDTCAISSTEASDGNGAPPPQDFASLDSPGCDASSIVEADGVVCADCAFSSPGSPGAGAGETTRICGVADEAACEVRENGAGDACQLCVTDGGVILYDDCFSGSYGGAERDAAFCEDAPGRTDNEVCTSCYADNGDSVSTTCQPRSDACTVVFDSSGRSCSECTADGVVVSRTCDAVDLDPSVCRAYQNDVGRCVDCLDDRGALLTHSCTPASGPSAIACEETFTPEGFACTVCVDENGTPFDRFCDDGAAPARCEQLAFTDQTCVICLDDEDAVVSIDCQRNDCAVGNAGVCRADSDCSAGEVCFDGDCVARNTGADPGAGEDDGEAAPAPPACAPPPACVMSVGDGGDVCRTCPLAVPVDGATDETLCIAPPALRCTVVDEATLAEDGSGGTDGDNGLAPQGRSCVVCADGRSGVEVYRDCEGNGNVPPPTCIDEPTGEGGSCAVCYDAVDNTVVYTSCDDETCFDLERQTLHRDDGIPLFVTTDAGTAEAVIACKQCGVPTEEGTVDDAEARAAFSTSCALENVCQDPYGSSFAGPSCPATTTLTLSPRACQNPWDAWLTDAQVGPAGDVALVRAVLSYALGEHAVALGGARVLSSTTTDTCPTLPDAAPRCDCSSGAVLELAVVDADVDAVRRVFAGLVD